MYAAVSSMAMPFDASLGDRVTVLDSPLSSGEQKLQGQAVNSVLSSQEFPRCLILSLPHCLDHDWEVKPTGTLL